MRVIVCGSRTWTDRDAIWKRLSLLPRHELVIVHGGAAGADSLAEQWADDVGDVWVDCYPADWKKHGKAAGPIRNSEMASLGADLCLAFRVPGKSNGTDDMIRKARAAGIPVEVIEP